MCLVANRAYIALYVYMPFSMGTIEMARVLADALKHSGTADRTRCLFRAERIHDLVEYLYICFMGIIILDNFSEIPYDDVVFFGAAIAAPLPFFFVGQQMGKRSMRSFSFLLFMYCPLHFAA